MVELFDLGFGPFFEEQLIDREQIPARIAAEHRSAYEIWSSASQGLVQLSGRLIRNLEDEDYPGVGLFLKLYG